MVAPRMAQNDSLTRIRSLQLDSQPRNRSSPDHSPTPHSRPKRPSHHGSFPSEDTIRARATPPIEIPGHHEDPANAEDASNTDAAAVAGQTYLQDREISWHMMNAEEEPQPVRYTKSLPFGLAKHAAQDENRGRSLAQALREQKAGRNHSESDRSHYDPVTGRHLPAYSDSPPKEEAKAGEARFPLLQSTVDSMARRGFSQPMSLTSETTMSPTEEAVLTPSDTDVRSFLSSPINIAKQFSTSYEPIRPRSQRKASERWRDGETAPDFFSRAGSLKKSGSLRRSSRRDTGSTKSPGSVASSFLRGFSMHSEDSGPPPVDAEGATVGEDYVLGKQIGYGGFSIIREVKQMVPNGQQRTLAVKIVRKQIIGKSKAENDIAQSDFEHEVDLWRLLNHKHVLCLEAVYELDEATFCFVPLNLGGTLFDLLSNNRQGLSLDLAANYAYQLASALRYLHLDARVVHRDIKLENVLVDTSVDPPLLRLCDFGLAEWITSDSSPGSSPSSSTRNDHTLHKYFGPADSSTSAFAGGSLEYAAPEILRVATSSGRVESSTPPEKSIVSPAVDIWAMGVCIFALIMGRRPFQDSFQPRIVMAILAGDWPKQALAEKAGHDACRVVKRCLAMSASQRATVGEIVSSRWFDEVRSAEASDEESAQAPGWRL